MCAYTLCQDSCSGKSAYTLCAKIQACHVCLHCLPWFRHYKECLHCMPWFMLSCAYTVWYDSDIIKSACTVCHDSDICMCAYTVFHDSSVVMCVYIVCNDSVIAMCAYTLWYDSYIIKTACTVCHGPWLRYWHVCLIIIQALSMWAYTVCRGDKANTKEGDISLGFFQYCFFNLEEVWQAAAPVYSRLSSSAFSSSLLLLPSLSLVGRPYFITLHWL